MKHLGASIKNSGDVIRTPERIIQKMWDWANYQYGEKVLDPCCGDNRILERFYELATIKPNDGQFQGIDIKIEIPEISEDGYPNYFTNVDEYDFFTATKADYSLFNICVMNPPFSNNGAYRFAKRVMDNWLANKGDNSERIIMICPYYELGNGSRKGKESRERAEFWNKHIWRSEDLANNIFIESGVPVIHSRLLELRHKGSGLISIDIPPLPEKKKDNQMELI